MGRNRDGAWNKKKAEQEKPTLVFVDPSAFYLLPRAGRPSAPVGQTPTLNVKLTRAIPGKWLVMWEGAPIPHGKAVKAFLTKGGARRIHLERWPASAPALHPQEGVWNLLKRAALKTVCCLDVPHVQREVRRAKERLRHRKSVLRQCFAHAGCSL